MRYLLVICVVVLTCGVLASDKVNKLKIAVYYESLCPDSKSFIKKQLMPVWKEFRGQIKVKLVPYGKSTHDLKKGKWSFECHHGQPECYGNKVQACILKDRALADTEKMDLIVCLMSQFSPDKSLDVCLSKFNKTEEEDKLVSCAEGAQGDMLLASYGDKTNAVLKPLNFVPTIVINEKFDQQIQDDALKDLRAVVCKTIEHKPSICL